MVLRGHDPTLDRPVALKLLRERVTGTARARLVREAQALARLSHPNVVQLYEVGEAEGRLFIAMELCPGQTLGQWQRSKRSWTECVQVYLQAGRGLAAAHAHGMVHRDFKPGNCILDHDGRVRVLDFGLARGHGPSEPPSNEPPSSDHSGPDVLHVDVTRTGAMLGTPAYMSPEQARGEEVDPRSDQFSFCVSLYEALHGHRPPIRRSSSSISTEVETGDRAPVTGLPPGLRRALWRGLAEDPRNRWPSIDALLLQLERVTHPRRYDRLALGLGLACATAAVATSWVRDDDTPPCRGSEQRLSEVWNDSARARLDDTPWSRDPVQGHSTRSRVDALLGDYAAAWVETRTRACEATLDGLQSTTVMDLRMACLEERRTALEEGLTVLVEVESGPEAIDMVLGLPSLRGCDDVDALQADVPYPDDPRQSGRVAYLRTQLARSRMLSSAGRFAPALLLAESLVPRVEATGHAPLLAEALLRRGSARRENGRFDEASVDLRQAYLTALSAGHESIATQAASRSALVALDRHEPESAARHWAAATRAMTERAVLSALVEAEAFAALGRVHGHLDEHETAIAELERARAVYERELGPDHPTVADRLSDIGEQLRKEEYFDESLAYHRRALATLRRSLGPVHPSIATSLNNHAGVFFHLHRERDAARMYRQALSIREQLFGPEHPTVAETAIYLGNTLHTLGEYEQALEHHRRAEAIQRRVFGDEHVVLASTYYSIAKDHRGLGRPEEAAAALWRAVAIDPSDYAITYELVQLELSRGRAEASLRAARRLREAARTWTRHADARPIADFMLARALWFDPMQRDRAVALATQAAAALESLEGRGADAQRHRRTIMEWLSARPRAATEAPPARRSDG